MVEQESGSQTRQSFFIIVYGYMGKVKSKKGKVKNKPSVLSCDKLTHL